MLEQATAMQLPPDVNRRLQDLMDRNNDGALSPDEREELECLVDCSEAIPLVRARALKRLRDMDG